MKPNMTCGSLLQLDFHIWIRLGNFKIYSLHAPSLFDTIYHQAWKTNAKPNLRYVGQAGINGLNHAMATVRQRWGICRTLDKARLAVWRMVDPLPSTLTSSCCWFVAVAVAAVVPMPCAWSPAGWADPSRFKRLLVAKCDKENQRTSANSWFF